MKQTHPQSENALRIFYLYDLMNAEYFCEKGL
jgi:hypothetical protein